MKIRGTVGNGLGGGTKLDLQLLDSELSGRLGGRVFGHDVNVTVGSNTHGRVGGGQLGFDVRGFVSRTRIRVRLGGGHNGHDLDLTLDDTTVTGRYGGKIFGMDVQLGRQGDWVRGRIGGRTNGEDVSLFGDAPLEVLALVAIITVKARDDDSSGG
jgi:hypothetical protein